MSGAALAPLLDDASAGGHTVVALPEYGITLARRPVDINRVLRRAGLLNVHTQAAGLAVRVLGRDRPLLPAITSARSCSGKAVRIPEANLRSAADRSVVGNSAAAGVRIARQFDLFGRATRLIGTVLRSFGPAL